MAVRQHTAPPGDTVPGEVVRPRRHRFLRRLLILLVLLFLTAGVAFGGLWVLTPSVSNAWALA
ncbi:MAG: hypothetical protein ABJB47_15355, partial [Actinomycetota bacterium]